MTALSAKEEEGLKKALGKEGRGGTKALGEKGLGGRRPWGGAGSYMRMRRQQDSTIHYLSVRGQAFHAGGVAT
jgi:hypothetical protein